MGIREIILVVLYLTSIVSAVITHEPQVYEELNEDMPEIVRRARHSDGTQDVYQPPVFNYRTATQQDPMKTRYHRQQQADFRHIKIKPNNPDEFFELNQFRGNPMNIRFGKADNDWKPFQPNYVAPPNAKSHYKALGKNRFAEIKQNGKNIENDNTFENDLDFAGSENNEAKAEENENTDRGDQNSRYIYVQPNILKNNFGHNPKTTQQRPGSSASAAPSANPEELQISELKELLGKNPEYQLQGLQKLLGDAKPVRQEPMQKETADVEIQPNSLSTLLSNQPPIEDLQQRLDAVNKAHEKAALAAAQKQAEAHVRAQHQAIALAQQRAEADAMAKIAAHNQGESVINPNDHLQILDGIMHATAASLPDESSRPQQSLQEAPNHQLDHNSLEAYGEKVEGSSAVENVEAPETSALNDRPYEEALLHPSQRDDEGYAPSFTDLRNSKPIISDSPGRIYQPAPFAKSFSGPPLVQPLAAVPDIYAPSEVQNYAPVNQKVPSFDIQNVQIPLQPKNSHPVQTKYTSAPLPTRPVIEEHRQDSYQQVDIDNSHSIRNQLYPVENHEQHDDLHQYAAKYAFGYRILDEKHGNDFGHEEERDGKRTKGHYFVLLPDGRRQKVDYFVDNSGYHAKVSYENVGRHPTYVPPHPQEHRKRREQSEARI